MRSNESTMDAPERSRTIKPNADPLASFIARLQRRLDDLSAQQERLVETREQLLVDREIASMNRKAIREQRGRTANTEIALLDALRKHYNDLGYPLPDDLVIAYNQVERHHSRLRSLEDEYLQPEENLGASEWKFIELETDLYQYHLTQLLSEELEEEGFEPATGEAITTRTQIDPIPPTRGVQYQAILADHVRLVKRFEDLRKQQALRMDTFTQPEHHSLRLAENTQMDREATQLSSDLLDLIAECEIRLQQLRPGLDLSSSAAFERKRPFSEPNLNRESCYERIETVSHADSEGTAQPYEDRIPVDENITEWSLQSLKNSALEKVRYLNFLRPNIKRKDALKQDFVHWQPLIMLSWAKDSLEWPTQLNPDSPVDTCSSDDQTELTTIRPSGRERFGHDDGPDSQASLSPSSHNAGSECQHATSPLVPPQVDDSGVYMGIASNHDSQRLLNQSKEHNTILQPASMTPLGTPNGPGTLVMGAKGNEEQLSEAFLEINYPSTEMHLLEQRDSAVFLRSDPCSIVGNEVRVGPLLFLVPFLARLMHSAALYMPWTRVLARELQEDISTRRGM
jgi:hypothetical protein